MRFDEMLKMSHENEEFVESYINGIKKELTNFETYTMIECIKSIFGLLDVPYWVKECFNDYKGFTLVYDEYGYFQKLKINARLVKPDVEDLGEDHYYIDVSVDIYSFSIFCGKHSRGKIQYINVDDPEVFIEMFNNLKI